MMINFYAQQSRFTDPGDSAQWMAGVGRELGAIRDAAAGLVFHYWGNGPIVEHGFEAERIVEIDLRYADSICGRLRQLNAAPPGQERKPTECVVGCCRDSTVLFVAMARLRGMAARARVGFASYLMPAGMSTT